MDNKIIIKCPSCMCENVCTEKEEGIYKCKACKSPLTYSKPKDLIKFNAKEKILAQMNLQKALAETLPKSDAQTIKYSLGILALSNNSFNVAETQFKKVVDESPENPDAYYYYSICLLNGKRPFMQNRKLIDQLIQYMNFAIAEDPSKSKYYYFKAILIYDYYELKHLRYPENFKQILDLANMLDISEDDKNELLSLINLKRPAGF